MPVALDPLGTARLWRAGSAAQSAHQAFGVAQDLQPDSLSDPTGQLWDGLVRTVDRWPDGLFMALAPAVLVADALRAVPHGQLEAASNGAAGAVFTLLIPMS